LIGFIMPKLVRWSTIPQITRIQQWIKWQFSWTKWLALISSEPVAETTSNNAIGMGEIFSLESDSQSREHIIFG